MGTLLTIRIEERPTDEAALAAWTSGPQPRRGEPPATYYVLVTEWRDPDGITLRSTGDPLFTAIAAYWDLFALAREYLPFGSVDEFTRLPVEQPPAAERWLNRHPPQRVMVAAAEPPAPGAASPGADPSAAFVEPDGGNPPSFVAGPANPEMRRLERADLPAGAVDEFGATPEAASATDLLDSREGFLGLSPTQRVMVLYDALNQARYLRQEHESKLKGIGGVLVGHEEAIAELRRRADFANDVAGRNAAHILGLHRTLTRAADILSTGANADSASGAEVFDDPFPAPPAAETT